MPWIDLTGYLASASVLATFCMGTMGSLRTVAMLSNVLFIAYGLELHLIPVFLLHATLLPINALKMVQLRRHRSYISEWLSAMRNREPNQRHAHR
jgi:CRP/FNR family transcriptional regulator, cyclic AMP receptor protein